MFVNQFHRNSVVATSHGVINSSMLPKGSAYGASFTLDQGLLLVGGEDSDRNALTAVRLLTLDSDQISLSD